MKAIKRDQRTSIRVSTDIMDLADEICDKRGYSKADIFERGVLLMGDNDEEDITTNRMYDYMINRFEMLDKKLNMFHEEIIKEIQALQDKKTATEEIKYTNEDVRMVVNAIGEIFDERAFWKKHGKLLDPLGKEFFKIKSKQYKVPVDVILEALAEKGYTTQYMDEMDINPNGRWNGLKKADKETLV